MAFLGLSRTRTMTATPLLQRLAVRLLLLRRPSQLPVRRRATLKRVPPHRPSKPPTRSGLKESRADNVPPDDGGQPGAVLHHVREAQGCPHPRRASEVSGVVAVAAGAEHAGTSSAAGGGGVVPRPERSPGHIA
jgi:hypothetical protein